MAVNSRHASTTLPGDEEAVVRKKSVRAMYGKATGELRRGNRALGISLLEQACRLYPRDGHSWLALAKAYGEDGDVEAASSAFDDGLRHCPDSVHLAHAAGVASARRGDESRARRYFERALELDPSNAFARHSLARLATTNRDDARRLLEEQTSAALVVARCELELERGEQYEASDAVRDLSTASRRFERAGDAASAARLERAVAKTTPDSEVAERALRRAVDLDGDVKSKVALARLMLFEKQQQTDHDVSSARDLLRSVVFSSSSSPVVFNRHGGSDDARSAYELLAKVEAEWFREDDGEAAAAQILTEATKIWGTISSSIWLAAGANARRLGNLDEASRCLERAAKLASSPTELSSVLTTSALVAADKGLRVEAERLFERAHDAEPSHGAAYAARGTYASKRWRDASAARSAFKRGLRALDEEASLRWAATLWHAWAAVESKRGYPTAARSLLLRGLKAAELEKSTEAGRYRAKDDAVLILHSLGSLELAVGRFEDAEAAFLDGARRLGVRNKPAATFLLGAARARLAADGALDGPVIAAKTFGEEPLALVDAVRLAASTRLVGGESSSWALRRESLLNRVAQGEVSARELFAAAAVVDSADARGWRLWAFAETKRGGGREVDLLYRAGMALATPDAALVAAFADSRADEPEAKRCVLVDGACKLANVSNLAAICSASRLKNRRGVAVLLAKLSKLELAENNADLALELAQAAVAAHDACGEAHLALGSCRECAGRPDDADVAYTRAIGVDDADGRTHVALANLRLARRDFVGARKALDRGLKAAPNDARVWHAAATLAARLGDLDGLAKLHKRASAAGDFFWRTAGGIEDDSPIDDE